MPGDHDLYLAGFADDNHECLRLLLFHAADVAQLARMALAAPISLNDAEGVHLLLEAGADPNRYADDADPLSPVIYAAIRSGRHLSAGPSATSVPPTSPARDQFSLAMDRFSSLVFATHGITPLGYAAFAFALGVTAGALIRRTVPAMAVTLAIFAAIQIAMPLWIRPHLFPARHTVVSVTSLDSLRPENLPGQPGAWLLSSETINAAGQPVHAAPAACPPAASDQRTQRRGRGRLS